MSHTVLLTRAVSQKTREDRSYDDLFSIAQNRIIYLKTEEKPTGTAIVQEEFLFFCLKSTFVYIVFYQ